MSFTENSHKLKRRFLIVALLLAGAAFYVLVRYFIVMINPPGPDFFSPPRIEAERGVIVDRYGRILALQTRTGNIGVWRPDIKDKDLAAFAEELSPLVELPPPEIMQLIENSATDFLYIKKQVDQVAMQRIQGLRAQGKLAGLIVEPVLNRVYPEKNLAAQIIGFTGTDNVGLGGIEYSLNEELAPRDGKNGNQVMLTIDTNVQYILEDIALRSMQENKAEAAMLLAMDPRTGDILGSASLPGFDPNNIRESTEIARMDRPAIWAFEPGSTFKVFSVAALLEARAIAPDTVFVCNGQYVRGRHTIRCLGVHGNVNAEVIIVSSCNAGAAYAAEQMSNTAFSRAVEIFGFGKKTGAGVPGETAGLLRPVSQWSERSRPTIAMGQEISVSALQLMQAMGAIANNGVLVPPRVVSKIMSDDGKLIREYQPSAPRRILSEETARNVRYYMEAGTEDLGIGRFARVNDVAIGVKTGTAQIFNPNTRTYSDSEFIASCIAILPADNPSLVLYMALVKPMGSYYFGSRTAAPAIREAAEALIDYLGIPRGRNPQELHHGQITLPTPETITVGNTIPDFRGQPKRNLIPLLLREDLKLRISGEGWVVRQTPPPGTPFAPGMTITLELE